MLHRLYTYDRLTSRSTADSINSPVELLIKEVSPGMILVEGPTEEMINEWAETAGPLLDNLTVAEIEAFLTAFRSTREYRNIRKILSERSTVKKVALPGDPCGTWVNIILAPAIGGDATESSKDILKFLVREQIESKYGDVFDIVADISKRVALLELITMRSLGAILNGGDVKKDPELRRLKPFVGEFLRSYDAGVSRDRVDVDPGGRSAVFHRLIPRFTGIADLLEKTYFNNIPSEQSSTKS